MNRALVRSLVADLDPLLTPADLLTVTEAVLARVGGIGVLDRLLGDDAISEIMVNGDGSVWVERRGVLEALALRLEAEEVLAIVERIAAPLGLHVDRRRPLLDARLPDGSRVHAVVAPIAVDGPCLTIRRFAVRSLPLGEFCNAEIEALLTTAVRARVNILVSGGTGAGKTTLLNALGGCIPRTERVITVEDTAELRLSGAHVVRLEGRPAGPEGDEPIPLGALVRTALRMRPDRIVVGEVRGPEALAMLQAMNTGHEGSLSTVHANSPADALRRLETLVLCAASGLPIAAVREHIAAAIDLVVQVARCGARREVVAVDEVVAADEGDPAVRLRTTPVVREGAVVAPFRRPRCAAMTVGS